MNRNIWPVLFFVTIALVGQQEVRSQDEAINPIAVPGLEPATRKLKEQQSVNYKSLSEVPHTMLGKIFWISKMLY